MPPSNAPETKNDDPAAGKLDVINGLRGAAIVAVVWHHLFGIYFKAGSELALGPEITRPLFFLSYGWIGVQLFFVLSGFVLYLPFARGRPGSRPVPTGRNSICAAPPACCRSITWYRCCAWY